MQAYYTFFMRTNFYKNNETKIEKKTKINSYILRLETSKARIKSNNDLYVSFKNALAKEW